MLGGTAKGREDETPQINMTPMVDVTFQLLIFFMLTAAFTITQSQQFPKPEQNEPTTKPVPPEEDPDFIIVRIDENNTYFISGGDLGNDEEEAPSPQELMVKLGAARGGLSGVASCGRRARRGARRPAHGAGQNSNMRPPSSSGPPMLSCDRPVKPERSVYAASKNT